MAVKMGDPTPKIQGRVTLSPLAHIDPIGIIMLVLFRFGYGKPVQINSYNFRNRRRGLILVSLAGITMNFILAMVFSLLMRLVLRYFYMSTLFDVLMYAMVININLMVFNLIPVPPLDGFKLVKTVLLNDKEPRWLQMIEQYSFIILAVLIFTNVFSSILGAGSSFIMNIVMTITGW